MQQLQQFKALGDESRLNIVTMLLERNYCVGALAKNLGISEAAVSQHLKVLSDAGLLTKERSGYFMHYDVDRDELNRLGQTLAEMAATIRQQCASGPGGCREKKAKCQCRRAVCADAQGDHQCHGQAAHQSQNMNVAEE